MARVRYVFVLVFLLLFIGVVPFSACSSRVVQVGAYNMFSVALMDNGSVWAWGDGPMGSSVPVMLDVSDVTAVAPGMNFILFLKGDGTVWACGDNRCGELGDGSNTSSYDRVVRVGDLSDVRMIAASGGTGMALKGDGTVWAWGGNSYGELGTGGTPGLLGGASYSLLPVQVPISDVTSITAGDGNFFALKSDGTLWGWGSDDKGSLGVDVSDSRITAWTDVNNMRAVAAKPIQIPVSGVTLISSNGENTLAIINGSLWAWGDNTYGQLGIGNTTSVDRPAEVKGLTDVTSAIVQTSYSVALKSDGTVWTWGQDIMKSWGAAVMGDLVTANTPAMVAEINDVTQLAGGYNHVLALKSDGTVWAWGSNRYNELGNGGEGSGSSTPVQVMIGSQTASGVTVPPTATAPIIANGQNNGLNTFGIIGLIILIILAGVFVYAFLLRKK